MSITLAGMRAKADQARALAESKYGQARDKYNAPASSAPGSRPAPNRAGSSSQSVPRPPARSDPPAPPVSQSASRPSPPQAPPRSSPAPPYTPNLPSRSAASPAPASYQAEERQKKVDWTNLSHADKQAFFALLDEYFENRSSGVSYAPAGPPAPNSHARPSAPNHARPTPSPGPSASPNDSITSYPPLTKTGSSASDFVETFLSSQTWSASWYTASNAMPPPLKDRNDIEWMASMQTLGSKKTLVGAIRFSDLSFGYYKIVLDGGGQPKREAKSVGRPKALGEKELLEAWTMYSEIVARFAEDAYSAGRSVGRGECWCMANEALLACTQYDVPTPTRSINRTHGHLIFEGRAWGKRPEEQIGRWRGGDDRIRRGDIVEWNTVTIRETNAPRGSWSTLGDPEHTAVIVEDSSQTPAVSDGQDIAPSAFGSITVIEQSQGKRPSKASYDLSAFEKGEMWIYRPISELAYLGRALAAEY